MKNLKELIGDRLRHARKAAGFKNQDEFAEKIGVDQSRVSRWESGQNTPDPEFRQAIHDLLGTTEESLFAVPSPLELAAHNSRSDLILKIQDKLKTLNIDQLEALSDSIDHIQNPADIEIREISQKETK